MVTWRERLEKAEEERCKEAGHTFQGDPFGYRWCAVCAIIEIIVEADQGDAIEYEDGMSVLNGRAIRPKLVFEPLKNRYDH